MQIERHYPIMIGNPPRILVILVGCGGTGSFYALHLARIAYHIKLTQDIKLDILFVDHDKVEHKNVGRQNFCPAEIGTYKAQTLATRYNRAYGLDIEAWNLPYTFQLFNDQVAPHYNYDQHGFALIVGAVDNHKARLEIHRTVEETRPSLWWLDAGNHEHSGQVALGNSVHVDRPQISFMQFCSELPAPSIQEPGLLKPPLEDLGYLSCADLVTQDTQSLLINQSMAGHLACYTMRLLITRDLDRYATYVDLETGTARSLFITKPKEAA
jgi:PRTRC genetic system ThiF family protein